MFFLSANKYTILLQFVECNYVILSGICVAQTFAFCAMLCRSLYVSLTFFFWEIYFLFLYDLRLLNVLLVSLNCFTESKSLCNTNPTKSRGEFKCTGRESSSCSTSCTHRVTVNREETWHNVVSSVKLKHVLLTLYTIYPVVHPI
jgi:hypothetical protein